MVPGTEVLQHSAGFIHYLIIEVVILQNAGWFKS